MVAPNEIRNHSPSEFPGRDHVIRIDYDLKGRLSLYELRESLVALAQNHYLSIKYLMNNYGSNSSDAIAELNSADLFGKCIFICDNNPMYSTIDAFWHINPNLTDEELFRYLRPGISKRKKPTIKPITTVVNTPKRWTSKKQRPRPKDSRGESNRIATAQPKKKYETVTGGGAPKVGEEDKGNTGWTDGTAKQFGRDIKTGNVIKKQDD